MSNETPTDAAVIPPSEWKRRRQRLDVSITLCWLLTIASWIYGAFGGTNVIVGQMWFATLGGAVGLVANYHWAATKDDGNRMNAVASLMAQVKK